VGLKAGMTVTFPKSPGARISSNSPAARLRSSSSGLLVTVPASAHSGRIMVLLGGGGHTSSFGPIYVYAHALHPPVAKAPRVRTAPIDPSGAGTALEGQGMWIWELDKSDGGSVPAIVAQAKASDVTTLFIKSSDATNFWSQFNPQLVAELHAAGLKVCAWQYVYGTNPGGEAAAGAQAVADGADCLVIDAEEQYEGKYAAAQTYITDLRAKIGASYPVALASFPYVYDHPSFPYSVFLGPTGAQYNAPQMYWNAIGVSVDTVYANTYIANRIYGRPIFPLGQTYQVGSQAVSPAELLRFREEAIDYGARGWSFWDWQETSAKLWSELPATLMPLTSVTPNTTYPELAESERGDQVLWMQEHLASAIPAQETTGIFDSKTKANLIAFQTAHGIPPSGVTDGATWAALLALSPVAVTWTGKGPSV
jgi:peptidoglycan hydrolase-like protein with peptidoglycan-binding domain